MMTPRYRRVIADQFVDGPRPSTALRPCASPSGDRSGQAGVIPGMALILGPDRPQSHDLRFHGGPTPTFALAGANQAGTIWVADINTLAGSGMYDAWGFDAVEAIMLDPRIPLNVLVRSGANVIKGAPLTTDALGRFTPAGAGERTVMIADETFNNNTGVYQHVRAIPVIGV